MAMGKFISLIQHVQSKHMQHLVGHDGGFGSLTTYVVTSKHTYVCASTSVIFFCCLMPHICGIVLKGL